MPKLIEFQLTDWEAGRELGRKWFAEHPQDAALTQLRAPSGKNVVRFAAASRAST